MKTLKRNLSLPFILVAALLAAGCLLVSGTFVIVEDFSFTAQGDFYFYQVDITDEEDWEEHKDQIDAIDVVGFEFFITSTAATDITFSAYVDDYSGIGPIPTAVPGTATVILDEITIPPGASHIIYAESLTLIQGVDRLKALTKTGQFDYYGTSSADVDDVFTIDSAKIIVTFSATE